MNYFGLSTTARIWIFLGLLGFSAPLWGQLCPGITLKKSRLPKEKKCESPCGIRSVYIPRSQASNMARRLAGWQEYMPTCDGKAWGNVSITPEYSHSLHGARIAQYLFGSTQLHFSGSQVPDRDSHDLLADNFGLATTFKGSIAFNPRIENVILDGIFHIGLDSWSPGWYFQVNFPVVVTRWDLGIHCNEVNNVGSQDAPFFPVCYMSNEATPAAMSIRGALSGNEAFGDMEQPLAFGAFPCGRKQKTGVAEIDLILGYTILADEQSHCDVFLLTVVPTGNIPQSRLVFEPLVGNGRLWELGPGVYGHYDLFTWGSHSVSLYVRGVITKQFKGFQLRSFDLIGRGPLSRYMLLKEFNENGEYDGTLINAIDFSTRATRVGGCVKADIAAKLSYYCARWGLDLGYNVYARTKEKLHVHRDVFPSDFNNRKLGIKGTEGVCYRVINTQTNTVVEEKSLNSVQNRATALEGSVVSNPQNISGLEPNQQAITWDSPTSGALITAHSSNPPLFLTTDSLDIISGSVPHQLTHKFFAHLSYTAGDVPGEPQIGVGGEVEVDGRSRILSGLEQWGVWAKIAFSF